MKKTLACAVLCSTIALSCGFNAHAINIEEQNGLVIIEAENFAAQHNDEKRRWLVFSKHSKPHKYPDADTTHYQDASAGKYIEILPDTRTNHFETLVRGENFSNTPGEVATLSYPVKFNTPGKYYVWARAYSSGSEDNGLHIGINGEWPESGQRLQLCEGKYQWTWSSAQRIPSNHCGTPNTISIDVAKAGVHNVTISMREDGFELDQLLLTTDKNYQPEGLNGKQSATHTPPLAEKQILHKINDYSRIFHAASDFTASTDNEQSLFPLKELHALALKADKISKGFNYASATLDRRDAGDRKIQFVALGMKDSEAEYKVLLNNKEIASFKLAKSDNDLTEHYFEVATKTLKAGDIVTVGSRTTKIDDNDASTPAKVAGPWRALVISRS